MAAKKKEAPAEPLALDMGRIERIKFCMLAVSPLNVRKDAEVGPDDELTKSIAAHGLLQPLIGYLAKTGNAMVLICAGQRRLLALKHIAQDDAMIPVRIVDEQTAIEVSLAENLERKAMNPVDELAAFRALVGTGAYNGNRIADRFGYDRRYVRRRLKMAVLHPDLLQALREGLIGIASAEAYAAQDDQQLQLTIFRQHSAPNAWRAHDPGKIIQDYNSAGLRADGGIGKFIGGVEAYEAEGGSCAKDEAFAELFETDKYGDKGPRLTDVTIVKRLLERAQATAQPKVEALAKQGFAFASAVDWCDAKGNPPKPPKKSDLVLLSTGWSQDEEDIAKLAAKVAKAGGEVRALAMVDEEGEPFIVGRHFLVNKLALDQVKPKSKANGAHGQMSEEERAQMRREQAIRASAASLYVRSLIGETPGFIISHVHSDWQDRLTVSMVGSDKVSRDELDKLIEPFIEQATANLDALESAEATKVEEAAAA